MVTLNRARAHLALLLISGLLGAPGAQAQGVHWVARVAPVTITPRDSHAIAYDSQRAVCVLFGGYNAGSPNAQTWERDSTGWVQRQVPGPSARSGHKMVYDPQRAVTVLFGGYTTTWVADTGEWDGIAWTQRAVPGPSARAGHAMVYDTQRHVTVLFGGYNGSTWLGDTWEFDGAAWTQRLAPGPPVRSGHAMAYDAQRGACVLFGGVNALAGQTVFADTWEWDGAAWTQRASTGPPLRYGHTLDFDQQHARTVLFGGYSGSATGIFRSDTWEWDGSAWTQRMVTGPSVRYFHGAAYDSQRGATVVFGGNSGINTLGDTWEWNGSAWFQGSAGGLPALDGHVMAFDQQRARTVLFGGSNGMALLASTWEWDGVTWLQRAASGPNPPRVATAMAYDSQRARCVLFGGSASGNTAQADTWEWDGAAWTQRVASGPVARSVHALAYDSQRAVTVLFGGLTQGGGLLSDTWEWNGTAWAFRASGNPGARYGHAMTYDSQRAVTVLFGGNNGAGGSAGYLADTWEWNGSAWTQRATTGPLARVAHALAYDSRRARTVLFGGLFAGIATLNDTWEWNGAAWAQGPTSGLPPARDSHAMAYDSVRAVTVLSCGYSGNARLADTWELTPDCTPPTVQSQPQSRTVCPSGSAPFALAAAGDAPLSYQWQAQTAPGDWQSLGNDPGPLPCGGGAFAFATPIDSPSVTIGVRPCPGNPGQPQHFRIRTVVITLCGSVTSDWATYTICPTDFDCNGILEPADVSLFVTTWFTSLQSGTLAGDFDQNGAVEPADVSLFVSAWFAALTTGCG